MPRTSSRIKNRGEKPSQAHRLGDQASAGWTFLSNHSHVMICLARDPEMRLRDIAVAVGITERATIRIISELEEAGYVLREKVGRRNRYSIVTEKHLRHPLESHHSIRGILALAKK
jgi:DNA-binding MarR family transcriptional regulator